MEIGRLEQRQNYVYTHIAQSNIERYKNEMWHFCNESSTQNP